MFGEYVPLGEVFPSLYRLTPLAGGLTAGTDAKAFDVAGTLMAPNICYETVLPHVIRRQVVMLKDAGREPDVLVTQTNDGWFWGSAALDLHLICGVFRAVECRKPLLIAANTGLSASIDASGNVLQQGPRRAARSLVVRPRIDSRQSPYLVIGDWFAWACAACCAGLFVVGAADRRKRRRMGHNGQSGRAGSE
jgi:apolipoprotein N-acyltransferase